ncbi:tyrosine-type recombinase/integrase [Vibrio neonatus]|uniref:tyrosine-type recombinase/integrase n=1 Tax=Vibrio neonatus TaxID=278860 RepID=UPI0021C491D9|nr:tyrosine-type recombinase/integrase [Vibrio neonatus]
MRKKCIPITDPVLKKQSCARFNNKVSIEDFDTLTQRQYSRNSLLSMYNDWNHFVEFCASKKVSAIVASTMAVRLFLEKQTQTRKYATIKRMAITIGLVHKFHEYPDPCNHRQIKMLLAQLRLDKKGDAKQAEAFNSEHLHLIQQQLDAESSLKQLRDAAILSVMFECAMKRSELRTLHFHQLTFDIIDDNPIQLSINDNNYQLSEQSSEIVKRWLLMLPEHLGPVFRRIDRHGNIGDEPLDSSSIYRVFRSAETQLDIPLKLSGQSARVGATKELAKQGYSVRDITDFGRWLSPAMPAQYLGKQVLADSERLKFKSIKPWD